MAVDAPLVSYYAHSMSCEETQMTTLRFHGGPAVLLIPVLLFVTLTAYLFIFKTAFDLTGLAAAGVVTLFTGSLLAQSPTDYWKATIRGASSELTGTVVLILLASGIFSAMMKASGLADGLVYLGSLFELTGSRFTVFVFLATSLIATATGSSIGTILAAMPIFFPAGVSLGADPALLAGAVLSGAIFGDNLAPVSDVTVISSLTQRFANGRPADVPGVVRTRLPYALMAVVLSLPLYALLGTDRPVNTAVLTGDPTALFMLIPVGILIAVAMKSRDVMLAISIGIASGALIGLMTGRLPLDAIFAVTDGQLGGFLINGITNVSPIILLCVTLFAFTGVVEAANVTSTLTERLLANHQSSSKRAEIMLATATIAGTTLFAGVTSAAGALVGGLTNDAVHAAGVHPYRRSHILSGMANSLPVLAPFSAFVLITMAALSGLNGAEVITPFTLMTAAFYPLMLFIVFAVAIVTGLGRDVTIEPLTQKLKGELA